MALTKKGIVEQIHIAKGFPRQTLTEMVTAIFDAVKKDLLAGNNVKLPNFGVFKIGKKRPRPGRNLQTGEWVEISARSVVTFKASRTLRNALKEKNSFLDF